MNRDDLMRRAFTELAPGYEETMDRELTQYLNVGYGEVVDRLVEETTLEAGGWALDLATGTAYLARRLAGQRGTRGRIVGLDITPAMLTQAKERIAAAGLSGTIGLICATAIALPVVHDLFGTVFCAFGTHHMDLPLLLPEIRRVLRPGGRLVLAAAGAPAVWRSRWGSALIGLLIFAIRRLSRSVRAQAEADTLRNLRTPDEWRILLSEAGFEEAEVSECRPRRSWYPRTLTIRAQVGEAFGRTIT